MDFIYAIVIFFNICGFFWWAISEKQHMFM